MKIWPGEHRIRMYMTPAGRVPFEVWIKNIGDRKTRQRIYARIDRLRLGNFGDCRGLGRGLLELRIYHGRGMRVYFTVSGRYLITLLCGGDKSTQERDIGDKSTQERDIRRARRYREEVVRDAEQEL